MSEVDAGAAGGTGTGAAAAGAGSATGSAGTGTGTGDSAAGSQGSPGTGSAGNGTPDFRSTIPEAYREKPWASGFKSNEDVFKQMDNLQGLLGKQGKLRPADDAPKEAWDQYYAQQGRPDSPDKYEFKRGEGVEVDAKLDGEVKAILHKHGIGAREAQGLVADYEAWVDQQVKNQNEKMHADFTAMGKELFGDKLDQKLEAGQKLLSTLVPEAAKKFLPHIDNNSMIVLAAIMDQVQTKYVGEDTTRLGTGGGSNGGETVESLQAKARELMASAEYTNAMHVNHDKVKGDINGIYERIKALKSRKAA